MIAEQGGHRSRIEMRAGILSDGMIGATLVFFWGGSQVALPIDANMRVRYPNDTSVDLSDLDAYWIWEGGEINP